MRSSRSIKEKSIQPRLNGSGTTCFPEFETETGLGGISGVSVSSRHVEMAQVSLQIWQWLFVSKNSFSFLLVANHFERHGFKFNALIHLRIWWIGFPVSDDPKLSTIRTTMTATIPINQRVSKGFFFFLFVFYMGRWSALLYLINGGPAKIRHGLMRGRDFDIAADSHWAVITGGTADHNTGEQEHYRVGALQ